MAWPKVEDVGDRIEGPLAALGFRRKSYAQFRLRMADGIVAHVGLDGVRRFDVLRISVHIGVGHQALIRQTAELAGITPGRTPMTLRTFLTALMSEAKDERRPTAGMWHFADANQLDRRGGELAELIAEHGMSFFAANDSLEKIAETLSREGTGSEGSLLYPYQPAFLPFQHPVALHLTGSADEAFDLLETTLDDLAPRRDEDADNYREFAGRLIERMEAEGWEAPLDRLQALRPLMDRRPSPAEIMARISKIAPILDETGTPTDPITETVKADSEDTKNEKIVWAPWPLMTFLNEFLPRHGFTAHGRTWRKTGRNLILFIRLEDHRIYFGAWFRKEGDEVPEGVLRALYKLPIYCDIWTVLRGAEHSRYERMMFFGDSEWDVELQRYDTFNTEREKRKWIRSRESCFPATPEWRVGVLHELMEDRVLPLLESIDRGRFGRFWLRMRIAMDI